MKVLRILDLFCGAGGAAMGLHQAFPEAAILGVDIKPQPRYPFAFLRRDALEFPLTNCDFIWASPPCQGYTSMRHAPGAKGAPLLIDGVRHRLQMSGAPWCIENVEAAAWAMHEPITLCGSMFSLGSQGCRTQRHRLFECNFPVTQLPCVHDMRPVIGIYGGHARRRAASAGGRTTRDVWRGNHKDAASEAMGIDWMTLSELSEAIPPAYSEYIGEQFQRSRNMFMREHGKRQPLSPKIGTEHEIDLKRDFPCQGCDQTIYVGLSDGKAHNRDGRFHECLKPTIVLAGDYSQFLDFIRSHGASGPRDRNFVFGDRVEKMMGVEASKVVTTGTFWKRKDARHLEDMAASRIR